MIDSNKIKPLNYLLNRLQETINLSNDVPKCSMLIGAGCSRSSNIPTGWGVIQLLRRLSFLNYITNGKQFKNENYEIKEKEFQQLESEFQKFIIEQEVKLKEEIENSKEAVNTLPEYLTQYLSNNPNEDIEQNRFDDRLYGFWFQEFSEDPRERQRFIEYLIDKSEPSGSYILLSHIIAAGKLSTIFTTNFDDLINDSLIKFTNTKPRVIAHNEISSYINPLSKRPSIIKLHGDFLFDNIKNIKGETDILGPNMLAKLEESVKNELDIVVVGYSGSDNSIMDALVKLKEEYSFGLYWCSSNIDSINWKAKAFINQYPNSYFIEVENFSMLTYYFYKIFETEITLPDYYEEAKLKDRTFGRFMKQLGTELNQSKSIDETEKKEIQKSFEIILDRNSFYQFHEIKNSDEKVEYLEKLRIDGVARTLKNLYKHVSQDEAIAIYKSIDDNMLIKKMQKAPLHIVSNALSNLKTIDVEKTKALGARIPNDYIDKQLQKMKPGEARSTLGELQAINPAKLNSFRELRDVDKETHIKEPYTLRDFINKTKTISSLSTNQLISQHKSQLIEKLNSANLKEVYLFISEVKTDSPRSAYHLFKDLDRDILIKKINKGNFDDISFIIALFTKIDKNRCYEICQLLNFDKISETVTKLSLINICSGLHALYNNNPYISHQLYSKIDNQIIIDKIKSSEIGEIAESLHYLSYLAKNQVQTLIKRIPDSHITDCFNRSNLSFQQLGNVCNKLLKLNYERFSNLIRLSDTNYLIKNVISSINKTGDQVFLHFVKSIFQANKYLLSGIIKNAPNEYINSIVKSQKLHLYTVNLPFLKNAFEMNNMKEEMKQIEQVINQNQYRFKRKKRNNRRKH